MQCGVRFLALLAVGLCICTTDGGYVFTTPRRWSTGAPIQTCASLTDGATFSAGDHWWVTVTELRLSQKVLIPKTKLVPTLGEQTSCQDVTMPETDNHKVALHVEGSLSGINFSEDANVTIVRRGAKTFIQPDKRIYKPGQTVNFRILTIGGPFMKVSTDEYKSVYIESPDGTRISQWLNVNNKNGLVHLTFDLHDEVDEGSYEIVAELSRTQKKRVSFQVKDYVLPRYEITITPPPFVLGSDSDVTLTVCAKYTFGQPVNGVANLSVAVGSWKIYANLTQEKELTDGCTKFTYPAKDLFFDHNNCHINIQNIKADAKVVESGTNNEIFAKTHDIRVHRTAVQFRDTSATVTIKQHLPSVNSIVANFPGNRPAAGEKIEACTDYVGETICKNFTTNDQGELDILVPSGHSRSIKYTAVNYPSLERNFNFVMDKSTFHTYRYSSKEFTDAYNSSITIFTSDKLTCTDGKDISFILPIIYVVNGQTSANLHIQGLSRGQVQFISNMTVNFTPTELPFDKTMFLIPLKSTPESIVRGMINVPVSLPNTISPNIKFLVWFKTPDNVVIADSVELDVSPCLNSNLDFSWSATKGEPGSSVKYTLKGEPNSLCSVGVVDKSVELLAGSNRLTAGSILQSSNSYSVQKYDEDQLNFEFCLKKYNATEVVKRLKAPVAPDSGNIGLDQIRSSIYPPYNTDIEALHVFRDAGYYVFSDLNMEKEFCDRMFVKALKELFSEPDIGLQPSPIGFIQDSAVGEGSFQKIPRPPISHTIVPASAPEASFEAADKEGTTMTEEVTRERVYFPETWLWLLQPISSTGEASETVTLPDTITEWVGSAVCVNLDPLKGVAISKTSSVTTFTPFFVDLTLPSTVKRGEILPVTISVFNYLPNSLPVKLVIEGSADHEFVADNAGTEDGTRTICIPPNDKVVETIKLKSNIIGDLNLTVDASINKQDTACNPNPPIKSDRLIRSMPVVAEGFIREKTWTKYMCAQDVTEGNAIEPWQIEVPANIVEGSERSWLTATGDLLGPSIENLGNLIRFPYGCGEQNMLNFAPNIFILEYLEASNQTTPEMKERIESYMIRGYQRQLRFRHQVDGSFSTFGDKDVSGSTWLTAFVLKSFAHAKKYIFIDDQIQTKSSMWLMGLQNKDGCFESRGRVVNKMLQGGLGNTGADSLLTAYVVAAFVESKMDNPENSVIAKALPCILKDKSTHPYNIALRAYSLALANAPEAKSTVDQLISVAASNSSDMRWVIPGQHKNSALGVETAAYALLSMLICDEKAYFESSRKVVRWLSSQRNGQGGFISTQDTIVALQALAYFQRLQPGGNLDLAITAKGAQFNHSFVVQESNKFLEQRRELPVTAATVDVSIQGTGCGLIQTVLRYNVLNDLSDDGFTLTVTATADKKCKYQSLKVCAAYTLSDGASNMAILEVGLVSGYVPVKQDLKDVVSAEPFKRYEVDGPKVTFYLEEITSNLTCADFRVYQEIEIESAKPGTVKVYDYYQPEFTSEKTYTFDASGTCSPSTAP